MRFARAKLWTVVPARGLAAGKSRLAAVLDARERTVLNRSLLLHTLAVIGSWSGAPRRTIVVSPCARVLALARKAGAVAMNEGVRPAGLNRAVRLGVERAAADGATHVLILPMDLPRLHARALRALAQAARGARCAVLAPDRSGAGTNALLLELGADFGFSFGPGSFVAHRSAARRAGLKVSVVRHADLQFDLDTPDDLAAMAALPYSSGTQRVNMGNAAQPCEEEG